MLYMQWQSSSVSKLLVQKSFDHLSDSYSQKILELKHVDCEIVHIVGDRYDIPDDISIKCDEGLRTCSDQWKFYPEYILVDNLDNSM